jgi:hypothetical protein
VDHVTLKTNREDVDTTIDPATGQQREYLVLSEEERAKGFVRPVRLSYRHVGIPAPKYDLRILSDEERERYADVGYVSFEQYPAGSSSLGRFWTEKEMRSVDGGCHTVTTMARPLAETYARSPGFYGGTFCCRCGTHFPVGERGEFVWEGTTERVGT